MTSAPTVMFCANTSWYLWNFRRNTIRAVIDLGIKVVCVVGDDKCSESLSNLGAHVCIAPLSRGIGGFVRDIRGVVAIYRAVKLHEPVKIFTFTPKSNLYLTFVSLMQGIPLVQNISGLGVAFTNQGLLSKILKSLYSLSFKCCEHVFFQNENDYQRFVELNPLLLHKSTVLPGSGVDLNAFRYQPREKARSTIFLFCSRLLRSKGLGELVEAFRLAYSVNQSIELHIYGEIIEGDEDYFSSAEIAWLSEDEGVYAYGSTSDPAQVIGAADCVVLPSYYAEGTPKILLEALAVGRVIITTDKPGCRDTVRNGNGVLVPARDVTALSEAIIKIAHTSADEFKSMCAESRLHAENNYDEAFAIKPYLKLLTPVLEDFNACAKL